MNDPLFTESAGFGPTDHTALGNLYQPRKRSMPAMDKLFIACFILIVAAILVAVAVDLP
jgi:hypothetical protein